MWTTALLTAAALLAITEGVCHEYLKDYYTELGCKPEATDAEGCPTSYDCGSLSERTKTKCHYQGQEFEEGHKLQTTPATACLAGCRCYSNNGRMAFNCANVECPDVFNGPPPPGCHRIHEHGKCCYVNQICGEEKTSKPTCEYKGEVLKEGQRFYPDEEPCLQCICQSGYNGSFVEPFCRKVHCNLELLSNDRIAEGCVPTYYGEKGCCPIDWRCPQKTDTVIAAGTKAASDTGKTCRFGDLTLRIGEKLSPSAERGTDTECSCKVPPHPVCVQKESS